MTVKRDELKEVVKSDLKKRELKKKREEYKKDFTICFKIAEEHKLALEQHFIERGINLSGGIRQLIYNYLKAENII